MVIKSKSVPTCYRMMALGTDLLFFCLRQSNDSLFKLIFSVILIRIFLKDAVKTTSNNDLDEK